MRIKVREVKEEETRKNPSFFEKLEVLDLRDDLKFK